MSGTRRRSKSASGYNANVNTNSNTSPSINHATLPEHTQILRTALHPFLFMGCWNYTSKTERGSAARDAVLAMIKTHPVKELLVVAGDNAYPDKLKVGG